MKEKKQAFILLALLVLIALVLSREWPWIMQTRRVHAVTIELPTCDRVEVCRLFTREPGKVFTPTDIPPPQGVATNDASRKPGKDQISATFPIHPDSTVVEILESKTVSGPEAEAIAALWRSQMFGTDFQSPSPQPVVGLRFYSGQALLFETAVSFKYNSFYVTQGDGAFWWGFFGGSPQATELMNKLQSLFPPPPVKAETKPAGKDAEKPGKKEKSKKR